MKRIFGILLVGFAFAYGASSGLTLSSTAEQSSTPTNVRILMDVSVANTFSATIRKQSGGSFSASGYAYLYVNGIKVDTSSYSAGVFTVTPTTTYTLNIGDKVKAGVGDGHDNDYLSPELTVKAETTNTTPTTPATPTTPTDPNPTWSAVSYISGSVSSGVKGSAYTKYTVTVNLNAPTGATNVYILAKSNDSTTSPYHTETLAGTLAGSSGTTRIYTAVVSMDHREINQTIKWYAIGRATDTNGNQVNSASKFNTPVHTFSHVLNAVTESDAEATTLVADMTKTTASMIVLNFIKGKIKYSAPIIYKALKLIKWVEIGVLLLTPEKVYSPILVSPNADGSVDVENLKFIDLPTDTEIIQIPKGAFDAIPDDATSDIYFCSQDGPILVNQGAGVVYRHTGVDWEKMNTLEKARSKTTATSALYITCPAPSSGDDGSGGGCFLRK